MSNEEAITYKEKEIEELLTNSNFSFDNLKYLAREVSNNSWSPLSKFHTGAIAVGIDQNKTIKVFPGTNVEPTVHLVECSERVAIYNGIAAGFKKFIAVATSAPKGTDAKNINEKEVDLRKVTPCGACREVMLQKLDPKGIILIDGVQRTFTPKELLPHPVLDQNKLKSLTIEEMDALDAARRALNNAHAPHTHHKYGVSLLVDGIDEIFSACSVDSNSTGLAAEPVKGVIATAIAHKGAKHINKKIKAVFFAFPFVRYPTGDVLQLIADYTTPDTKIVIDNMGITTIEELLPWAFTLYNGC